MASTDNPDKIEENICNDKKDVIDEAIDRIKEKLRKLRLKENNSEREIERRRRFQDRIKAFSSLEESNSAQPAKPRGQERSSNNKKIFSENPMASNSLE